MSVQVITQPGSVRAQLKLRQSVTQLSAPDLERFRTAMEAFKQRGDNKGYEYFANWHWVAFSLCEHHNDLFLPWHRGYLYHFELALQDIDPEVTIPWWNWMDEPGLPAAFTDAATAGGRKNPLLKAPIRPSGVQVDPNWPTETSRDPGAPQNPAPVPPPLRMVVAGSQTAYDWMMSSTSYEQFEQRCWRLHDNIHLWVGGSMSDQSWAGYDPLFWAHHSMVDRLWRLWQSTHPSAVPNPAVLSTSLTFASAPSLKVSDVLDVKQLGYDYAAQVAVASSGGAG
jgi:tyrosinase